MRINIILLKILAMFIVKKSAVILLCLTMLLGCSKVGVKIPTMISIPGAILGPVNIPRLAGYKYKDFIKLAYNEKQIIKICNLKLNTINLLIKNFNNN
jgi:hypothetical protein